MIQKNIPFIPPLAPSLLPRSGNEPPPQKTMTSPLPNSCAAVTLTSKKKRAARSQRPYQPHIYSPDYKTLEMCLSTMATLRKY
jgi:hypothetical protein